MSAIITISSLSKIYHIREWTGLFKRRIRTIEALKDINLEIDEGELFGLLGPNGAGKTTLIKCITTLLTPTRGQIMVNNFEVGRQDAQVRASLGCLLGGERSLYWKLTGRENLEYFAALYHVSPTEAKAKIQDLSHLLNLGPLLDRSVETYSSGQKMALAFAKALINEARILILDEPTNALDVPAAQAMRQVIKNLNEQGYTIILTSHHMDEIEALCQRVAIVDQGIVIAAGTISELKSSLDQHQIIRIEGIIPPPALAAIKKQADVIQVIASQARDLTQLTVVVQDIRQTLPTLMQNLLAHQSLLEHISPATITLEDVFMAKTGRSLNQETWQ